MPTPDRDALVADVGGDSPRLVIQASPQGSGLEIISGRTHHFPLRGRMNLSAQRPTGLAFDRDRGLLAVANRSGGVHLIAIEPRADEGRPRGDVAVSGPESRSSLMPRSAAIRIHGPRRIKFSTSLPRRSTQSGGRGGSWWTPGRGIVDCQCRSARQARSSSRAEGSRHREGCRETLRASSRLRSRVSGAVFHVTSACPDPEQRQITLRGGRVPRDPPGPRSSGRSPAPSPSHRPPPVVSL